MSSSAIGAKCKDTAASQRCFVALPLPEAVLQCLSRQQEQLRRNLHHPALRWVPIQQMHLTLLFLGEVEANQLEGLQSSLLKAVALTSPFQLSTSGLGCFPKCTRPRVLWAGLHDDEETLRVLQRRVVETVKPFAKHLDQKSFRPHLTLARFKSEDKNLSSQISRLLALPNAVEGTCPSWLVTRVHLMRSELRPEGAVHSVLSRAPLLGK